MTPFVAAQVSSLVECIRLLEAFVTSPLGLYSDIRMLRESLPFPESADLPRYETQARRIGYKGLTDDPRRVALQTLQLCASTIEALEVVGGDDGSTLDETWVSQAGRVLARVEQKVAGELRAETASSIRGLYVIVDPEATDGRPVVEVAGAALAGGASVIQLRDKTADDKERLIATGQALKQMCDEHKALFVMNDDPSLALASDAHGLHLGQADIPVAEARRVIKPSQVIGRSNNSVDEVVKSQAAGADYLAVGAVFATSTMGKSGRPAVGVETVARVKDMVDQPIVAIGGIDRDNIADVVRAGADCVCVVSAITLAKDPESAARSLYDAFEGAGR